MVAVSAEEVAFSADGVAFEVFALCVPLFITTGGTGVAFGL